MILSDCVKAAAKEATFSEEETKMIPTIIKKLRELHQLRNDGKPVEAGDKIEELFEKHGTKLVIHSVGLLIEERRKKKHCNA